MAGRILVIETDELNFIENQQDLDYLVSRQSLAAGTLSAKLPWNLGVDENQSGNVNKDRQDHVARRERKEKDLIAVYLTGSVTEGEPLLGGTTDIDMVFVHKEEPAVKREVIRVTYEISLDIEHHHQSYYTYHRRLRKNPWFGHHLCKHQNILLDKDHWLEFLHASVSSGFNKPENVYARAVQFSDKAREQWFDLDDPQEVPWGEWIALYFKSVGTAANGIACLEGTRSHNATIHQ